MLLPFEQELVDILGPGVLADRGEVEESDCFPGQIYMDGPRDGKRISEGGWEYLKLNQRSAGITFCDKLQEIVWKQLKERESLQVILGPAGTGKTFLTVAHAVEMMANREFDQILYCKPLVSVSRSRFLGTLPGTLEEKIAPFVEVIFDTADALNKAAEVDRLFREEAFCFLPLDFIRGRNLSHKLVIVDEIQNLDRHELLSLVSRIDSTSKMILLGDPNPIQKDIKGKSAIRELLMDPRFWESTLTSCNFLRTRKRHPVIALVEDILSDA